MAEIAPAGGGPNRLFVVIAIGLVGLLLLGLVAVGGILIIPRIFQTSAPPTVRVAVTTPTRIFTPTSAPTATDTPAPTATSVIAPLAGGASPVAAGGTVTATSEITGTPGVGTPGTGQLPKSGLGEDLLVLAGGVVLVLIVFAARRARSAGAT